MLVVVVILAFITGLVVGATYHAYLSGLISRYDVLFMFAPSTFFFAMGYFLKKCGKKLEYRPLFQSRPVYLSDGDQLVMSALKRFGFEREKGEKR